ncbi:hypothetical protein [Streptomyces anulatus]|uniref:hypothetical protein n=1 Tax=Streptomyces anulatus TaxID=1892 RepID=UPI00365ED22B
MFEIRVICDPADAERITTALNGMFDTGTVRRYPSRGTDKDRLYISADHRPEDQPWPDPETAYALAPSIISEIGWVAHYAANRPFGAETVREFWLRKAALLDRLALGDAKAMSASDATQLATEAAGRLRDFDDSGVICDPRHYVRQQYAAWARNQ